jgi:hypothetical protein
MRKLLSFVLALLILLSTVVMAQGGPMKCKAGIVKSCWGQWDATTRSINLPYVPSLIVLNVTRTLPASVDERPYQQVILRSMNDQNETFVVANWKSRATGQACTATFSLTKQTLTLKPPPDTTCSPAVEYTLIP